MTEAPPRFGELIVMRLADMTKVHPSQDDTKVCSRCGERVGIYPSGQQALRRFAYLQIVCQVCCVPPSKGEVTLPAVPFDEIVQEMWDSIEVKKGGE